MKILSVRKGFLADHSSTSYEFYAVEQALNKSQRAAVSKLSSRARPRKRRVSFIYHGDWSDLPGGWEPLVEKYYDVMYSESYDWWTLAMAFNTSPEKIQEIQQYAFDGEDEMGVRVYSKGNRVIISIFCRLDYSMVDDSYMDYDQYNYYDEEDDEEEYENSYDLDDSFLELLTENREYLKNGDYRLLYGVWQRYGFIPDDNEDEKLEDLIPPEPSGMKELPEPIERLISALN